MRHSLSIVPDPDDRDIYLVLDDFGGHLGRAWPEADEERTDRETVIIDLLDGQFSNPVRVVSFNTAKGWSRDVSEEIADELRQRLARRRGPRDPTGPRGFHRATWRRPAGATPSASARRGLTDP
jgi:hypothetical protein